VLRDARCAASAERGFFGGMRSPKELTPAELASLRLLWAVYPDEILMRRERERRWIVPLVAAGLIEATEYEQGIAYRLSAAAATRLARVVDANGEAARWS
jgi:hypothetical protein